MTTFTAFCRESNNRGTTWIDTVEADCVENAISAAEQKCAGDWGYPQRLVTCIGIANAETRILFWDDLED